MTTDAPSTDSPESDSGRFSRRGLLLGGAGIATGVVGGFVLGRTTARATEPEMPSAEPAGSVAASGVHQAGVARPSIPQRYTLVQVGSLASPTGASVAALLADVGAAVLRVTDADAPLRDVTPDGPGELTVTVGIGPRLLEIAGMDAAAATLPPFKGDDLVDAGLLGGDLLISVNADDPSILEAVLDDVTPSGLTPQWRQLGVRGDSTDGVTRNPFGYHDGIIIPRGEAAVTKNVWIADGPLAGGTIGVVRRFVLDTAGFRAQSRDRQDAVIGRHHDSGAPLSGGARGDEVNLLAKSPSGDFLTPARSHARAAHPSFTGSDLMLRRSYAFHDGLGAAGLAFISFQKDVRTFIDTQLRLDEVDDLMTFARPAGGGAFAILPGFSADRPLGATLF